VREPEPLQPMTGDAQLDRRDFLAATATALAAVAVGGCAREPRPGRVPPRGDDEWEQVRARFRLDPERIHMAGMLLASHPRAVHEAITRYREELDRDPAGYVEERFTPGEAGARRAAAEYMGARSADVALTDSTTMGIGLVYNGIALRQGQEIVTTMHDYHATHDAVRYRAQRGGATIRRIALHDGAADASEESIVAAVRSAIRPHTRVLAFTWVHSSTGLKLPLRAVSEVVAQANSGRAEADRLLLCVDGVHGLGVEADTIPELGCDFFMAGTHKWVFAPRGTGVVWGSPAAQVAVTPTIPTFSRQSGWGPAMTPGGFKAFEHQWAMAEAFAFHQEIGKQAVAERIHVLASQAKEGLAGMGHIRLHTPRAPELSSGIVCFEVSGMSPAAAVRRLRARGIISSTTPYSPSYARLSPGLLNTPAEVDATLAAIRELG
jgi:isopenicillin-N epimerase